MRRPDLVKDLIADGSQLSLEAVRAIEELANALIRLHSSIGWEMVNTGILKPRGEDSVDKILT